MNTSDRSLKDMPSVVTKASPNISLVIPGYSMESMVKEDAKEEGDCEECSQRSTCKGFSLLS